MRIATIVGALVGSLVGAIGWYFLETGTPPRDASWAPLMIGLLAGLGSRMFDRASPSSYVRGALTAAVAVAVMLGSREAITYAITTGSEAMNQPMITADASENEAEQSDANETDERDSTVSTDVEDMNSSVPVTEPKSRPGESAAIPVAPLRNPSGLLAVYYAVGVLLAYGLGKGSSSAAPVRQETERLPPAEN